MTSDPLPLEELTRRWAAGWARTRVVGTGTVAGWPIVHVRSASRSFEIVCAEPDPETWDALLDDIAGDRTAMLTLVAADPDRWLARLPNGVQVDRDDESLMLRQPLGQKTVSRAVDLTPYDVDVEEAGGRVTVRLLEGSSVAAEGTVGVLGGDAVFDRVETTPQYRRRGLGSWVMGELEERAAALGAGTGLLVASPDGAALYGTLGWQPVAPLRSLRGGAGGPP